MTNKEKARAYFGAVNAYDQRAVESMVEESYIQHNPYVPTGRAAFVALLPRLKEHGSRIENQRILQDGAHVVMHHVWRNALPFGKPEAVAFHIVRFGASGTIAEHWNVMCENTPANASGRAPADGEAAVKDLERTQENKWKIRELFALWVRGRGNELPELLAYFHAGLRQHHPLVGDGLEELARARKSGIALRPAKLHKVFGEGNFVLSISEGALLGKPAAAYDLFRLEEGKIAEHWNVTQEIPQANLANENTMFGFEADAPGSTP